MDSFISIYTLGYNPLFLHFVVQDVSFTALVIVNSFNCLLCASNIPSSRGVCVCVCVCVCACVCMHAHVLRNLCSLLSYSRRLSNLTLCIAWPNTRICHFTKEGNPSFWRMVLGVSGGSDGRESTCNVWDLGPIPGLGRSPGGGDGNPLQFFCLKNPHRQRSLAGYSPWGCKELDMTKWLSTHIMEMVYRNKYFYLRCPSHYWMVNFSISQLAEKQTGIHISKYILNTSLMYVSK